MKKMKVLHDKDGVFVTSDNLLNQIVFGTCHDFCVAAAAAMVQERDAVRHISFVDEHDDQDVIAFKEGGKILMVTIEYVDEHVRYDDLSETLPYERLSEDVVLIDGKHYKAMTDDECAEFIWDGCKCTCFDGTNVTGKKCTCHPHAPKLSKPSKPSESS